MSERMSQTWCAIRPFYPPNAGEKLIWQVKIKSYPPEWQVTKSASFESLKTVPLSKINVFLGKALGDWKLHSKTQTVLNIN